MKHEIEINAIRSRPRFKVKTNMTVKEFTQKMKLHLNNHNKVLGGYINDEIGLIYVRQDKDKFWSPRLQIRIEKDEKKSSEIFIRGIFGPRTSVWTLFMFSYGLGGAILLTTGIYGWIELALGIGNLWVWSNLLGLVLIIGSYISARIGQKIAKSHMKVLRAFIERVLLEEKILQPN